MISIIVPIYNVEKYLDECITSLVNQTYTDIEIILIDDGSPDNCPKICDDWAEKDSRIKVIHKTNGGLSDARNAGMRIAHGEYIGFIDSDDYVDVTMYEKLLNKLIQTDSDISACGVLSFWEDGRESLLTAKGEKVLDNVGAMESLLYETWLKQPVWYKLYKKTLIEDIPFVVRKCHEDVFWSYQPIAKANRVCVFDEPLYFYRQRGGSIMGDKFSVKRIDALEAKAIRLSFVKEHYPKLSQFAQTDLFFFALYLAQMAAKDLQPNDLKYALSKIQQYVKKYPPIGKISVTQKLWAFLTRCNLGFASRLRNMLKIGL